MPTYIQMFLEKKNIILFSITLIILIMHIYLRVLRMKKLRRDFIMNDPYDYENTVSYRDVITEVNAINFDMIRDMKRKIRDINEKQNIINKYRDMKQEFITIIVVQVNTEIAYLKELLRSLKQVTGITKSLIIFSHDYFNEEINNVIRNITYAKVMQIFYPYSVQLHPLVFPGQDRKYCEDSLINCKESYNQRIATLSQIKNHWWWITNQVFDHLEVTKAYNGTVVFLEEDQYVTEDFIFFLKLLERTMIIGCPHCEMISLGARAPSIQQYIAERGSIIIEPWGSSIQNIGVAFNRTFWNVIKGMSNEFCNYNDYNWDYTLEFLATKRPKKKFYVFTSEGPRVLRVGRCQVFDDNGNCDMQAKVDEIQGFIRKIRRGLFPTDLVVKKNNNYHVSTAEGYGGWGDLRDRELCMYIANKNDIRL